MQFLYSSIIDSPKKKKGYLYIGIVYGCLIFYARLKYLYGRRKYFSVFNVFCDFFTLGNSHPPLPPKIRLDYVWSFKHFLMFFENNSHCNGKVVSL